MPEPGAELAQWDQVLGGGGGKYHPSLHPWNDRFCVDGSAASPLRMVEANQIPHQGVRDPVLRVATRADTLRLTRFAP